MVESGSQYIIRSNHFDYNPILRIPPGESYIFGIGSKPPGLYILSSQNLTVIGSILLPNPDRPLRQVINRLQKNNKNKVVN